MKDQPLFLIPARVGSKRIPHKNFMPCGGGASLVQRTIDLATALDAGTVVLSTDHPLIQPGGPVLLSHRPSRLATDEAQMADVVRDVIKRFQGDPIILLEPTAALRTAAHIASGLFLYEMNMATSVVSVVKEQDGWGTRDGTFYIFRRSNLAAYGNVYGPQCLMVEIPQEESLSVDEPEDWERAERLLASSSPPPAPPPSLPSHP